MGKKTKEEVKEGFHTTTKHVWVDVTSEVYRQYEFADGSTVRIDAPLFLAVGKSGHRVFSYDEESGQGVSHYIPSGWKHLSWNVYDDQPAFVK